MLLLHQMITGSEGHKMSVVSGSRNRDTPCATDIGVTELIGQLLELVSLKPIIIPEHVVVTWPACPLDALVAAEIEVELRGVGDTNVNRSARRYVARLPRLLLLVSTEKPGMMAFLDNDEGYPGLVVRLQLDASLADGGQLVLKHMRELSLRDAVPVHDDPVRLVAARALVEHHQVLFDHR